MLGGAATARNLATGDLISISVESALQRMAVAGVVIPSLTGATARRFARLRLPVWMTVVSPQEAVCQGLQFSYGVHPVHETEEPEDWSRWAKAWVRAHEGVGESIILIEGPSPRNPDANHKLEIIDLKRGT